MYKLGKCLEKVNFQKIPFISIYSISKMIFVPLKFDPKLKHNKISF